jgi:exodeoxyribonuclease VII small subunit
MADKDGIQKKLNELDKIVKYFEQTESEFDLDEAVSKYEQAMQLVSSVKKELGSIELKINEIQKKYTDTEDAEA